MIKRTSTDEFIERSVRSAREKLSRKRRQLRNAEIRCHQATDTRCRQEILLNELRAVVADAQRLEGRRRARLDTLARSFSQAVTDYREDLLALGLTEREVVGHLEDLVPAEFLSALTGMKKASA